MKDEIWKDIPEYEGLYQVSSLGKIKSLNYRRTNKEHILKQTTSYDGYKLILLHKNGVAKMFSIHRLVAKTFLEDFDKTLEVNHKDNNRTNNCIDNIEMVTHIQNTKQRDLTFKPVGTNILTIEEVKEIRKAKALGKKHRDVWKEYSNKLKIGGFDSVWYGNSWKGIN